MVAALLGLLLLLSQGPAATAARKYQVGAFYYGPWHVDPTNEKLHGKNWTEWNLVKSAKPRFPGHQQPNVPLWGYQMDNDPAVMAQKIDAAADHGVDHFLFDWYWYNETSTHGKPGLFQDSALEDGFLKAPNRNRMEFALMWASQVWMNVHPSVGPSVSYGNRTPTFRVMDGSTFDHMTDHIVTTYFSEPNYLRVQTTKGGPRCLFFSIYETSTFAGDQGGPAKARAALDSFRAKVRAAGLGCLHINSQSGSASPSTIKALGIDSTSNYCWYHTTGNVLNAPRNFPVTSHAAMLNGSIDAWHAMTKKWKAAGYHYIPNLSVQWDSSPRTVETDTFQLGGYPFTGTFRSTPTEWLAAVQAGKKFLDSTCDTWCPITINAWNEWSEGAYIEPDVRYGMKKLEAIKQVFGPVPARPPPPPPPPRSATKVAVGAIRWDAWYGEQPGDYGVVGRTVTEDMSYHQGKPVSTWHYRVPFFGSYHSSSNHSLVDVNGNSPTVMSQELQLAQQFGIDFFSYCIYPWGCIDYNSSTDEGGACQAGMQCCANNFGLSYALKLHLASPDRARVNFTLLLQGARAYHSGDGGGGWFPAADHGGNETLVQEVARYVGYFQLPFYHKVLGGRPLVFVLNGAGDNRTVSGIAALQDATNKELGVRCYIVYMGSAGDLGRIGADAVSRYMIAENRPGGAPYVKGISTPEAAMWASSAKSGVKLVPSITAGSDSRPRQEYPLPWGRRRLLLKELGEQEEEEEEKQGGYAQVDQVTTSDEAGGPFCAVATQAHARPYAMGEVQLACTDSTATIAAIGFADFGTPDTSGGCTHFASNATCSEKAFASGWAHHCVGKHTCSLDPNDLQPPKHPDPCTDVPKVFAIEASCSGTGGGKATVTPAPPGPPAPPPAPHQESWVVDPTMEELQQHTEAALEFALDNEETVDARAVLISAWNENDEGHWVVPSLMNGTAKLEAVQRAINSTAERRRSYWESLVPRSNE